MKAVARSLVFLALAALPALLFLVEEWPQGERVTDGARSLEDEAWGRASRFLWREEEALDFPGIESVQVAGRSLLDGALYFSGRKTGGWDLYRLAPGEGSRPEVLVRLSSAAQERDLALSADGRRLFFASDRPGGPGGYDLYQADWHGDDFEAPIRIEVCATTADERRPCPQESGLYFTRRLEGEELHRLEAERLTRLAGPWSAEGQLGGFCVADDGRIFFSERRVGSDHFDLYRCLGDGLDFGPAKALGELNTDADEVVPVLDHGGLWFQREGANLDLADTARARCAREVEIEVWSSGASWDSVLLRALVILVAALVLLLLILRWRQLHPFFKFLLISILLHLLALLYVDPIGTREGSGGGSSPAFQVTWLGERSDESRGESGAVVITAADHRPRSEARELARPQTDVKAEAMNLQRSRATLEDRSASSMTVAVTSRVEARMPAESQARTEAGVFTASRERAVPSASASRDSVTPLEVEVSGPAVSARPTSIRDATPNPASPGPQSGTLGPRPLSQLLAKSDSERLNGLDRSPPKTANVQRFAEKAGVESGGNSGERAEPEVARAGDRLAESATGPAMPLDSHAPPLLSTKAAGILDHGSPGAVSAKSFDGLRDAASATTEDRDGVLPDAPEPARTEFLDRPLRPAAGMPQMMSEVTRTEPRLARASDGLAGELAIVEHARSATQASRPGPRPEVSADGPAIRSFLELRPALVLEEKVEDDRAFASRRGSLKARALELTGGGVETERAVLAGLRYLRTIQNEDGSWGDGRRHEKYRDRRAGMTGLCLLAFLGAGHDQGSGGEFSGVVGRALDYLLQEQAAENGHIGDGSSYGHGIATYALAEAFASSRDRRLRAPLRRAVGRILDAQFHDTGSVLDGGWGYYYRDPDRRFDDWPRLSVTVWQVMALKSAELGGLHVPDVVLERARAFILNSDDARLGALRYNHDPGWRRSSYPTLPGSNSAALFAMQLLDVEEDSQAYQRALDFVIRRPPEFAWRRHSARRFVDQAEGNLYFHYYAALALHRRGGATWAAWNEKLKDLLLGEQSEDGSWRPISNYADYAGDHDGNRAYTTAISVLMLEVYYRYFSPLLAEMNKDRPAEIEAANPTLYEVVGVEVDSSAYRVGLRNGDLLVEMDAIALTSRSVLKEELASWTGTRSKTLTVLRGEERIEIGPTPRVGFRLQPR